MEEPEPARPIRKQASARTTSITKNARHAEEVIIYFRVMSVKGTWSTPSCLQGVLKPMLLGMVAIFFFIPA